MAEEYSKTRQNFKRHKYCQGKEIMMARTNCRLITKSNKIASH